MKILCNRDYNLGQEEIRHFEKGKVYEVSDTLGARLLRAYGPGSPWVSDGVTEAMFEEVGDRRQATGGYVGVGGQPETGASGEIDHTHMSDSELQHADKKAEKRVLNTDRVAKDQRETEEKKAESAKANQEENERAESERSASLRSQVRPGDTTSRDLGSSAAVNPPGSPPTEPAGSPPPARKR